MRHAKTETPAVETSSVGMGRRLHPWPLRIMHWVNAVVMLIMITSGWGRFWPLDGGRHMSFEPTGSPVEALYDKISELSPQNETQRTLQAQALNISMDLGRTRLLCSSMRAAQSLSRSW
jgi:hypothetical protein